jgi:hypothetical protein
MQQGLRVALGMSRIRPEYLDPASDRSVAVDVFVREEPEEEEDEDEEHEDEDDDDKDDEGYSE